MATLALIGPLGLPELLIIFVIVLLIFGPKNLPKLGRMFGSGVREFRDATTEKMNDSDEKDSPESIEAESREKARQEREKQEKAH